MRPRRCCRGSAQRSRFYPPFPLPLDFSLCLFLSATLSHCLSRSFVLSLFLSRCFHLSLFLHPPISFLFPLSFCLSLTLSLFLFLSVLLSRPLSSSAIYFSLSPRPLIVYVSLPLYLFLFYSIPVFVVLTILLPSWRFRKSSLPATARSILQCSYFSKISKTSSRRGERSPRVRASV